MKTAFLLVYLINGQTFADRFDTLDACQRMARLPPVGECVAELPPSTDNASMLAATNTFRTPLRKGKK